MAKFQGIVHIFHLSLLLVATIQVADADWFKETFEMVDKCAQAAGVDLDHLDDASTDQLGAVNECVKTAAKETIAFNSSLADTASRLATCNTAAADDKAAKNNCTETAKKENYNLAVMQLLYSFSTTLVSGSGSDSGSVLNDTVMEISDRAGKCAEAAGLDGLEHLNDVSTDTQGAVNECVKTAAKETIALNSSLADTASRLAICNTAAADDKAARTKCTETAKREKSEHAVQTLYAIQLLYNFSTALVSNSGSGSSSDSGAVVANLALLVGGIVASLKMAKAA